MKNIVLLLVALCYCTINFAQAPKVEITLGPESDGKRFSGRLDIIGKDANNIYITHTEGTGVGQKYYFSKLDAKTMATKSSEGINEHLIAGERTFFQDCFLSDGKLNLITYRNNRTAETAMVYRETLDAQTMEPANNGKLLLEAPQKKLMKIGSQGFTTMNVAYTIKRSRDRSKILLYRCMDYQKDMPAKVHIAVYDSAFNMLWDQKFEFPGYYVMSFLDAAVTNSGKVYTIQKKYFDGYYLDQKLKGGGPNYDVIFRWFDQNTKKVTELPITFNQFLEGCNLLVDSKENPVIAGCYSFSVGDFMDITNYYSTNSIANTRASRKLAGTFYILIDTKTNTLQKNSFKPFSTTTVFAGNSAGGNTPVVLSKLNNGSDYEMKDYAFYEAVMDDNDEVILLAEQFAVDNAYNKNAVYMGSGFGTPQSNPLTYNYNNALIVRLATDGKIKWATEVLKRQKTQNAEKSRYLFSYFAFIQGGNVHVIYNDHEENKDQKSDEKLKAFRGNDGMTMMVSVDINGNQAKQLLIDQQDIEVMISPDLCKKIDDRNALLFGVWKGSHQVAKLTIK